MAFEAMKGEGSAWAIGTYEDYANTLWYSPSGFVTKMLVQNRAKQIMNADRARVGAPGLGAGIDPTAVGTTLIPGMSIFSLPPFNGGFNRAAAASTDVAVRAAGGDTVSGQLSELTELARKQVMLLEEAVRQAKEQRAGVLAPPAFRRP